MICSGPGCLCIGRQQQPRRSPYVQNDAYHMVGVSSTCWVERSEGRTWRTSAGQYRGQQSSTSRGKPCTILENVQKSRTGAILACGKPRAVSRACRALLGKPPHDFGKFSEIPHGSFSPVRGTPRLKKGPVELWRAALHRRSDYCLTKKRYIFTIPEHDQRAEKRGREGPVSYTHLTLPTICSV